MRDLTTITDWRTRDEDLPNVPPGRDCERVITPQKHVVLQKIVVPDLKLVRLRIGAVYAVPFEICGEDGALRIYRPALSVGSEVARFLADCGAQFVAPGAIRVVTAMDVVLILRNDRAAPAKPRASLIVREEDVP